MSPRPRAVLLASAASLVLSLAATPGRAASAGFDIADRDTTCAPCTDFYTYANGGWLTSHTIPPTESSWGSFDDLAQRTRERLRELAQSLAARRYVQAGTSDQKVGDYYAAAMDSAAVEKAGLTPLEGELAAIEALGDVSELPALLARLHGDGVNVLFRLGSSQDAKHSEQVIAAAGQGGLGLPDRDYYFRADAEAEKIRNAYRSYLTQLFTLSGAHPTLASANAQTVFALETRLAAASMTRVERRDPQKTYHKMSRAEAGRLTPHFSWDAYLAAAAAPVLDSLNVAQPAFFTVLDSMLAATPIAAWRTYCRAHLLDDYAAVLPAAFVHAHFDFNGRVLQGTHENLPRWRRALRGLDADLGEALGQLYVEQNFPPAAKARMQALVQDLIEAFREDITTLDWMSADTKKAALGKLDTFTPKIGYPDVWRDYGALAITRGSWAANHLAAARFAGARDLAKIGKPVDRLEWGMTPPTINAYYNAGKNEIVFPAGILQPPFFDLAADDAINYGAIGMVIGHEMSHGFDDRGRQFDARGNLHEWWTAEDRARFTERAACVEKLFDGFVVQDSLHMKGKLVLGESLADLGGMRLSYRALQRALKRRPQAILDGYTPEQRFFLGFARIWAELNRPEAERLQIATDPHPLGRFRVNGTVVNMPEFREAFGCAPDAAMVRGDGERCRIW